MRLLVTIFLISLCLCPIGAREAQAQPDNIHILGKGYRPNISVDSSGNLYAVFISDKLQFDNMGRGKCSDICYSESIDGGAVWTEPVIIPRPAGAYNAMFVSNPDIAIEADGSIDIVWSDTIVGQTKGDIFFTHSSDKGTSWTKPVNISHTDSESMDAKIVIGLNNSINVVWQENTQASKNWEIYYSCSADSGKTWGKDPLVPAQNISNNPGCSSNPMIAVDSAGMVHVVWLDTDANQTIVDIYYAHNLGKSWSKPFNISHSSRTAYRPDIACGAKAKVYISWSDIDSLSEKAKTNVWCAVADKTDQFADPINLSDSAGFNCQNVIAADRSGQVAVVWSASTRTANKPDIYARVSKNGGNEFGQIIDISNTEQKCKDPKVIITNGKMIVVWGQTSYENRAVLQSIKTVSLPIK